MNTDKCMNRRDFLKSSAVAAMAAGASSAFAAHQKPDHVGTAAGPAELPGLIVSAPVLQNAAETSVGVSFAVSALAAGWVDVSTSPALENAKRYFAGGTGLVEIDDRIALIRVTGLKASTRYYYRIGADRISYKNGYDMKNLGSETDPKVYSFTTLGAQAAGSFCVINDTHDQKSTLDRLFAKIAEIKPAAVLWNGDATNVTETREHAIDMFLHTHRNHPEYASFTPYMFINGNHDLRGRFARHMEQVLMFRDPSEREGEFCELGRNFVQRLGDIALIGLDTGEDKLDTNPQFAGIFKMKPYRELQTRWLEKMIESPAVKTARFKVAFCHIPLYDPRPDANPGDLAPCDTAPGYKKDYAAWQRTCANLWGPLFERAGVQLVVTAHQHRFRSDPPCEGRSWWHLVGGGWALEARDEKGGVVMPKTFPTVIEGRVKDGRLVVTVHNIAKGAVEDEFTFS